MCSGGIFRARSSRPVATLRVQACSNDVSKALPYCDTTLSHAARVEDLLSRLSTADKVRYCRP